VIARNKRTSWSNHSRDFGQIETQIKDLDLDKHIQTLNDYKTPPELAEGKKQLGQAQTQIDNLMTSLPSTAPDNLKKEAEDLQAAMSRLNTGVDELITEVRSHKS